MNHRERTWSINLSRQEGLSVFAPKSELHLKAQKKGGSTLLDSTNQKDGAGSREDQKPPPEKKPHKKPRKTPEVERKPQIGRRAALSRKRRGCGGGGGEVEWTAGSKKNESDSKEE